MPANKVTPTREATWVEKATGQATPTREATTLEKLTGQATPTREATWLEKATGQATPTREATTLETLTGQATPTREATWFEQLTSGGGIFGTGRGKARGERRGARGSGSFGIGYWLGEKSAKLAIVILVVVFIVPGLALEAMLPFKRGTGRLWLYSILFWSLVGGTVRLQTGFGWPAWIPWAIVGGLVGCTVFLAQYMARRARSSVQSRPASVTGAVDAGAALDPSGPSPAQPQPNSQVEALQPAIRQSNPVASPSSSPPVVSGADPLGAATDFMVVPCPACGRRLRIIRSLSGKQGRCPKCQAVLAIP